MYVKSSISKFSCPFILRYVSMVKFMAPCISTCPWQVLTTGVLGGNDKHNFAQFPPGCLVFTNNDTRGDTCGSDIGKSEHKMKQNSDIGSTILIYNAFVY